MEQYFLLGFEMQQGTTRTIRVNHVNPTISNAGMRAAMNNIVSTGVLNSRRGVAVAPRRASLLTRTFTPIPLP